MGAIGIFLLVSAVIVLFPVLLQVRMGESRVSEIWGYFIFIGGLVVAAFADSAFAGGSSVALATVGVITAVVGLVVQSKLPQKPSDM
jgi:hypothetical protein